MVEPYLNRNGDAGDYGPFPVLAGHLFVLGDDRINSNDSRYAIGQVALENVIGKVVGFESADDLGRPLGKPTLAG